MRTTIPLALLILSACGSPDDRDGVATAQTDPPTAPAILRAEQTALAGADQPEESIAAAEPDYSQRIEKSEAEWRALLSEAEFYVTREEGTERAFTGRYWDNKDAGTYACVCCGVPLFASETKFKSGTGWPSFYAPLPEAPVAQATDFKLGYARTEIECGRCDAHLGHVFEDGPDPTGLRYCMNGTALLFDPLEVDAGAGQ